MRVDRWLIVLLCLVAGCSTPDEPVLLIVPALEIVAGDAQVDTVARELPNAITVRVRDSATQRARAGAIVNWVVVQGGGSVFAAVGATNDSGIAQQRWTLGTTAGPQALEARAIDPETGQPRVFSRITATARPGPLAYSGFTSLRLHTFTDSITLPIEAHDAYNNDVAAPLPSSPDGLALVQVNQLVRATPDRPGLRRLVLDAETLRVVVHPPAGPFVHRRTIADTVWEQTGTITFSHLSGSGTDSSANYLITGYRSVKRVLGVATDSITFAGAMGTQHYYGPIYPSSYTDVGIGLMLAPSTAVSAALVSFVQVDGAQWIFANATDTVRIR